MLILVLLATGMRPAVSQESGQLAEILVTAQKREERLQDVPIADSVVTADAALNRGVASTIDLPAAVPGLVVNHTAGAGNFFIRGVGTNLYGPATEPTVAMYADGVYLPSAEANMFTFNNIDRIEVLKGPQGTLFGRNTTGGVVQIVTRDPTQKFDGNVSVGYANYDTVSGSGYVSGGLVQDLAADLAVTYSNQGIGWGHNFTTGRENADTKNNWALRSKWIFTPTDSTTLKLILADSHTYLNYAYQQPPSVRSNIVPTQPFPGRFNAYGNLNDYERIKTKHASIQLEQDAGAVRIVNILSYVHTQFDYLLDNDTTPSVIDDITLPSLAHDWTEELQIQNPANSKVKWMVGGFYFDAYGGFTPADYSHGTAVLFDHQITRSPSGFGQATIPLIADTNLTVGARYTSETQSFIGTTYYGSINAGTFAGSQTFSKTTWRAALDHRFTDDVMAYVSANRGFKSGGYNSLAYGALNPYKPETLDAYEIGFKTEWFNHRLRWNSAAFLYNYTDIQIEVPVTGGQAVTNGPRARIKGLEGELQAKPLEQLNVAAAFTYLDGHYLNYPEALAISAEGVESTIDAAGNRTLATPKFAGNLSVDYTIDLAAGKLQPTVSATYNDGYFFYADNRLAQPSYWYLNTSLTWFSPNDAWRVQLWGRNLNNRVYYQSRSEQLAVGDVQRMAAPRTFGITLRANF